MKIRAYHPLGFEKWRLFVGSFLLLLLWLLPSERLDAQSFFERDDHMVLKTYGNDRFFSFYPEEINYFLLGSTIALFVLAGVFLFLYFRDRYYAKSYRRRYEKLQKTVDEYKKRDTFKSRFIRENLQLDLQTLRLLNQLQVNLSEVSAGRETIKVSDMRRALEPLERVVVTRLNSDELHRYYSGALPVFYARLAEIHPDISQADKRLCALIMLKFNDKEIAGILGIHSNAMVELRLELRKKLELTNPEITLEMYLRSTPFLV